MMPKLIDMSDAAILASISAGALTLVWTIAGLLHLWPAPRDIAVWWAVPWTLTAIVAALLAAALAAALTAHAVVWLERRLTANKGKTDNDPRN